MLDYPINNRTPPSPAPPFPTSSYQVNVNTQTISGSRRREGVFWWSLEEILWVLSAVDIPVSAARGTAHKLPRWRSWDNGEESVLLLPTDLNCNTEGHAGI